MQITKPVAGEFLPYAAAYIDQLPDDGNVLEHLHSNMMTVLDLIASLPPEKLAYRYAPGKWTIKDIIQHITDTERVFAYRAMCVARNDQSSFPGFEQDDYVAAANANDRSMESIMHEYEATRKASLALLHSFTEADTLKMGTANNNPISVRAIIYQIAGHELHHLNVMRDKYL